MVRFFDSHAHLDDEKFDIDREIIAILPQQEIKELQVLIPKIDEVKLQYLNFKDAIYKEILKRYNEYVSIQKNSKILKLKILKKTLLKMKEGILKNG